MKELGVNANGAQMHIAQRGHGTRNSLHSAVFAPSFIPPESHLILWEFSINDCGQHIPGEQNIVEQQRSMLLAWLKEIERLRPDSPPPKVIFVYLWKSPILLNNQHRIMNPVHDAHAHLAREFDFVVGHVNVASYIEGLELKFEDMRTLFLSDAHHPNKTGHLVISFLLLNLLRGFPNSADMDLLDHEQRHHHQQHWNSSLKHSEQYTWFCGTENEDKRFVRSQIVEYDSEKSLFQGWRSPLGVATMEMPQNDIKVGSRQLVFDQISSTNKIILGKQDPRRNDRQGSVALSCCMGENAPINGYTTVSVPEGSKPMKDVQSLFLGFAPQFSDVRNLKVYVDSVERNVDGRLIRALNEEWPCFWSWQNMYTPMWFAFSKEQASVSSIHICVENNNCDKEDDQTQEKQSQVLLISIAAY